MKGAIVLITAVSAEQPSFEQWASEWGFNSNDNTMREKYLANVKEIEQLNADPDQDATFAVNQFSGLTFDEFAAQYLTAKPMEDDSNLPSLGSVEESDVTVSDVDWDVTPVKDQGQCGSCWAFGTIGSIEHVHKLNTGSTVSLAEQQLVDCDTSNSGCNGGWPYKAMNYLADRSIYTTSSYKYTGRDGSCKSGTASGVTISGYKSVSKSDSALASALGSSAVTVTLQADSKFQHYSGGILTGVSTACNLNHAVLATGYGSNFWKIKNSWGSSWGEKGFVRIQRTTSGCGPMGLFYQSPVQPTGVSAAVEV
jgi:hypothetical protein